MDELRSRISELEHEKAELQSGSEKHEAVVLQELTTLKQSEKKKTSKLQSMDKKLQGLTLELTTTKELLASKEGDLQRVTLDLEKHRAEQVEPTQRVTTKVLDSDMSKEEAESADNVRSIIYLPFAGIGKVRISTCRCY